MSTTQRPAADEFGQFYTGYISLVSETDIVGAMRTQLDEILALLRKVPEKVGDVRHAPYTWSIKEVVGHMSDCERIMTYRALRFARGDAMPLPGFEENDYVRVAGFDRRTLASIIDELESVRRSSVNLFENLPDEAWPRRGEANKNAVTVRALAYVVVGHARHHLNILRKRLTTAAP